jgi:DNA-binding winged helix-turn-helix (wHTH) protein
MSPLDGDQFHIAPAIDNRRARANAPKTRHEKEPMFAPIRLAHTANFGLGPMRVRPAAREVEVSGAIERLEPRVMQVLVALYEADGDVVSRDELIARCWAGVIVGEDAINRVMVKLRRLSQLDGGRSFALETVPRVGYRLNLEIVPALERTMSTALYSLLDRAGRHWGLISVAVLATAAMAISLWSATRMKNFVLSDIEPVVQSREWDRSPALPLDGRFLDYARYEDASESTKSS